MMTRTARLLLTAALLMVAAACGEATEDAHDTGEAPEEAAGEVVDDATPQGVVSTGLTLESTELGDIVATPEGRSVYLFEADQPGESTCFDACAASWPPVLLDGDAPDAGDGVDADLISTTERPDGGMQLTYDGWPLYLWAGDQAAGDVAGQGVSDVWWVITADGSPIREAMDGAADGDDEGGSYGY